MSAFERIEAELDVFVPSAEPRAAAQSLLGLAEQVLEEWIRARGGEPTADRREGFRLLALHHPGARGEPSFNACRESCREIVYHYNLLCGDFDAAGSARHQRMMALLAKHLLLFVGGKIEVEGLGEFCCASRPLRIE